jgi:hypothetical protein
MGPLKSIPCEHLEESGIYKNGIPLILSRSLN